MLENYKELPKKIKKRKMKELNKKLSTNDAVNMNLHTWKIIRKMMPPF